MIHVSKSELNTYQTAKQTTRCASYLCVLNRQQLSGLLYMPLVNMNASTISF